MPVVSTCAPSTVIQLSRTPRTFNNSYEYYDIPSREQGLMIGVCTGLGIRINCTVMLTTPTSLTIGDRYRGR